MEVYVTKLTQLLDYVSWITLDYVSLCFMEEEKLRSDILAKSFEIDWSSDLSPVGLVLQAPW